MLRFLLNVIWLIFAGFATFLSWLLAALIMFILIITIPFGLQAVKIAFFSLWPFGRTLVRREDAGAPSAVGNVLWIILCGWWLALIHLITGILQAITIIGIPLALGNWKLIPIAFHPFGRERMTIEEARARGGLEQGVAIEHSRTA